jgi:hypothetical protein
VEQYSKVYTQVRVYHVRNELEQLRNHRSAEDGNLGCTCRKLVVYLPPTESSKKAQHCQMNERKVKEERRKRHLLPELHS